MLFRISTNNSPSVVIYNLIRQCQCRDYSKYSNSNLKHLLLRMPRNKEHIADAQRQRLKIKEKSARYVPGTVNLQIIGSGAPGSPASVYLFTDQSRYLFNCGEGTQRLAYEHKTKLARLEHIFMTQTSWSRIGGLPGLSLTVQDAGVPSLTLHAPPGMADLFQAMRRFVILKDLKVDAVVCESGEKYEDAVLTINYVPLKRKMENVEMTSRSGTPVSLELDDTNYYSYETTNADNVEKPLTNNELINSDDEQQLTDGNYVKHVKDNSTSVMSFICQLKPRPGALDLEKCVDKGVPPGPLLGKLKNGIDVSLPNGTVVRADDVRGPDDPGPVFCIIDIPSEEYLNDLIENQCMFEKFQSTGQQNDQAGLVLHFSPTNIIENPIYQNFMNKFCLTTKHLILNDSNNLSGYLAAHRIQSQLNLLSQHMFPMLREQCLSIDEYNSDGSDTPKKRIKLNNDNDNDNSNDDNSIDLPQQELNLNQNKKNIKICEELASSLTYFHLRPYRGLDRSAEANLLISDYINEANALSGFTESLDQLKSEFNRKSYENDLLGREEDYPKIVFLGTGSCIPNKTRNVSSILIHTSPNSCILLDCGEGTTGQLIRFYGVEKSKEIFHKLKAIYISHLHADHHIGLIGILQERRRILDNETIQPILLLAPIQISSWLQFYDKRIENIKSDYHLIGNADLLNSSLDDSHLEPLGLSELRTCLVRHCPHSFGVMLEISAEKCNKGESRKITYSGDTMPCEDLITLGKNSDILIHEATMEDELVQQAKIKMHSTVSQAIEQGQKMNAKYTILTHFSQRYAKLPRIELGLAKNVGIAFDNMEVTETDLKYLHLLHPTLKILFAEHCEEMEQKALKRAFREQRTSELKTS